MPDVILDNKLKWVKSLIHGKIILAYFYFETVSTQCVIIMTCEWNCLFLRVLDFTGDSHKLAVEMLLENSTALARLLKVIVLPGGCTVFGVTNRIRMKVIHWKRLNANDSQWANRRSVGNQSPVSTSNAAPAEINAYLNTNPSQFHLNKHDIWY